MEKTLVISMMFILLGLLASCKKNEEEKEESFVPLSASARLWFNDVDTIVYFKSNTGLSDSYKMAKKELQNSIRTNDVKAMGETINLDIGAALDDYHFVLQISNKDYKEGIYCSYSTYVDDYYNYVTFNMELTAPYNIITPSYYDPVIIGATIGRLIPVSDTLINNKRYTDIYSVHIDSKAFSRRAVNDLYISKSKGLVAFITQKDIIWYRE